MVGRIVREELWINEVEFVYSLLDEIEGLRDLQSLNDFTDSFTLTLEICG